MVDDPNARFLRRKLDAVTAMIELTLRAARGESTEPGSPAHGALIAWIGADADVAELDGAIVDLRARFDLTPSEDHLLWALIAYTLEPDARKMIRSLADPASADPAGDVLRRLIHGTTPSRVAWTELADEGTLRRFALIERTDGGGTDVPIYRQTFNVAARILAVVHGVAALDPMLGSIARWSPAGAPLDELVVGDGVIARARAIVPRPTGFVVAVGDRGVGRRTLLAAAARGADRQVLEVDARAFAREPERLVRELRAIARECRLSGAVPLIRELDALAAEEGERLSAVDRELIAALPVVLATAREPLRRTWSRPVDRIELPALSGAQRTSLWQSALGVGVRDAEHLSSTYPIAPALVICASDAARAHAAGGALAAGDIRAGLRSVLDDRLAGLATRIEPRQSWDDLVLRDDQLLPIVELIARIRRRHTVYEEWGFADKLGAGLGVAALFSGPPGTGKTMVAGLIAKDVGTEIYRVDLAKIVSKWVGETEKHLAALFDAAEAGRALLLFDEADALFTKRTEVRSSNDRYANLEVNYLLQRLETFTGICILTSNHESAIDDAFRRRLSLHVRFTMPDVAERISLWRAMLPRRAPVAADLDFERLATRFEMTGGHIRNAALRGAFLAAEDEVAISAEHLWRGAQVEYESMGRIAGVT